MWLNLPLMIDGGEGSGGGRSVLLWAGDGIFMNLFWWIGALWLLKVHVCSAQELPSLFEEDLLESLPFLVFPSVDVMLFLTVVFILHHLFASSVLVRLLLLPEAQSKTKPASLTEDMPLHRDEQSAPLRSLKRLPPAGVFLVDEARVFITERSALQTVSPQSGLPLQDKLPGTQSLFSSGREVKKEVDACQMCVCWV